MSASFYTNFEHIKKVISDHKVQSLNSNEQVKIVAVSKLQPKEKVLEALEYGHRCFGENRVQEAQEKWPDLKKKYPDIELHLIGHLQRNKVAEAVSLFDVIETLDSERLALALKSELDKQGKNTPLFIQVNTGEETQKTGVLPKDINQFTEFCVNELELNIQGLMCIPPVQSEPSIHFAYLKKVALEKNIRHLSMGMSADYEAAIEFGATYIRLGTSLFGPRSV